MPHQPASGREHPGEFTDDSSVVGWMSEETERCEKIEDYFETVLPSSGQSPHIAVGVSQHRTGSAIARDLQEVLGVVDRIDVVAGFGK